MIGRRDSFPNRNRTKVWDEAFRARVIFWLTNLNFYPLVFRELLILVKRTVGKVPLRKLRAELIVPSTFFGRRRPPSGGPIPTLSDGLVEHNGP
jgi:hypothetical protein